MEDWRKARTVVIEQVNTSYCCEPPFHPSQRFPEYQFENATSRGTNPAYDGVRQALLALGLDAERFGSPEWNPLGELVCPGSHVLLKPNLIRAPIMGEKTWGCVVTHGSVVRAVLDYASLALKGLGQVTIADGPDTEQDFEAICHRSGLYDIVHFYRQHSDIQVDLVDTRSEHWVDRGGVILRRVQAPGDPLGSVTVDLGASSCFADVSPTRRYYGADYDTRETNRLHGGGHHVYSFSRSALKADLVINLPKMKTHKKVGVTLSLKNIIGLTTHRNCLPHYTLGFPEEGGDQYDARTLKRLLELGILNRIKPHLVRASRPVLEMARLAKALGERIFQRTDQVVRSGNWWGNDTAWRMVLDLNRLFFYCDADGQLGQRSVSYLSIVDGICAGEGNGPLYPEPVAAGLVVGGFNPVAVDTVCATLMGFQHRGIPVLKHAWELRDRPLAEFQPEDIVCLSNQPEWNGGLVQLEGSRHVLFRPHFGWKGRIERAGAPGS